MFDGKGLYTWTNGERYEGDYVRGKKHGIGIFFYKNGERYHGEFNYGIKTGKKTTFI